MLAAIYENSDAQVWIYGIAQICGKQLFMRIVMLVVHL